MRTRKNRRTISALLLALVLALSLGACGGDDSAPPSADGDDGADSAAVSADSGGSAQSADTTALEGKYISVVGEMFGMAVTGEEIAGFALELSGDGEGVYTAQGNTLNITWEGDGSAVTLLANGQETVGQVGEDCLIFDDMFGMGIKMTFAKEGSAAADPALYLPEGEKAMLGSWQSTEVRDLIDDPVDPAEMAPDALKATFYGDHTVDITVGDWERKGLPWSNLDDYGSVESDELDISWRLQEDGSLKLTFGDGSDYYIFYCSGGAEAAG